MPQFGSSVEWPMAKLVACVLSVASVAHAFRPMAGLRSHRHNELMATAATTSTMRAVNVKPTKHDIATGRDPQRVKIFDTTLRDGEQSPGCTMTGEEKIQVARQLARLGVDVIEAGFPFSSPGDFEAVTQIANEVGNYENPPIICGLARATKGDIEACAKAIKGARFPRIHTFIATSDIHMEFKLKKSRADVLRITREMVGHARSLCEDVEFSAEDALRSDPAFLCEVYAVAIEAGATTLNVPDTVGYTTPSEFMGLIEHLRANVPGIDACTISVHGHDDLGMAVANFLAAIEGGARQVADTFRPTPACSQPCHPFTHQIIAASHPEKWSETQSFYAWCFTMTRCRSQSFRKKRLNLTRCFERFVVNGLAST